MASPPEPPPVYSQQHPAGFTMSLGAIPRERPPDEEKYHLSRLPLPRVIDLSQPYTLSRFNGLDLRPEIEDQGPIGACASYSAIACARIAARAAGRFPAIPPMLTGDRLYEIVRRKEGSWPADSGSNLADNLDTLLSIGDSLESSDVEHHDAGFDYGDLGADESSQIWVASHHPFRPVDGQVLENLATAFAAGYPCQIGMYWAQSFFNPDAHGVINPNATPAQAVGGHAIYAYAYYPPSMTAALGIGAQSVVACANNWTSSWCPQVTSSGIPDMRPGEFLIPASMFLNPNGMIFELQAVAPKAFTPDPKPQPQPQPPAPTVHDRYKVLFDWFRRGKSVKDIAVINGWQADLDAQCEFKPGRP